MPVEVIRDAADAAGAATTVSPEPSAPLWRVDIEASVEGFDAPAIDAATALEFSPDDPGDPFGIGASCSGLYDEAAAYSVFVSGGSALWYVGLWTSDPLDGPGIYDVQVRVEHGGVAYDATGTMTLDDALRSADFLAFGAEGGVIEGRFECAGGGPVAPLVLGAADGDLDSIDVFALLRRNGAIRVAGLATTELLVAACPAVVAGADERSVVSVRGGPGVGSISRFEVDGRRLLVRAGSVDYDFEIADLRVSDGAGTITASDADETVLDAAYRCT